MLILVFHSAFYFEGYILICIGIILANAIDAFRIKAFRIEHVVSFCFVIMMCCMISEGYAEMWFFI